jgi:hypothetical protein
LQRQEIIELALQLAERKGEKTVQLKDLYRFVLQDICKRERFWWRRVAFSFALAAGTATYDLTAIAPTPSTALTEINLDEITKFTIILSPNPFQTAELAFTPDPETLIDMINNTQLTPPSAGNSQSPGGRYCFDGNDYKTVRIDPPDLAYTAYIVGWGMPNPPSDSTLDAVPLIPPWGHNTIVEGMKAYLFDFAYGADNPKAMGAHSNYERAIQDLASRRQPDPNYRLQLALAEDAVRST